MLADRKGVAKDSVMTGAVAVWYARITANDLAPFRACARLIADRPPPGPRILEIAPGPGYLAIELARIGRYEITGVDLSDAFVAMAVENAAKAGVTADFRVGNAAALPFAAAAFDFIVCRAAFKNFREPEQALREMHRVLRPGGEALIIDMRRDASNVAIDHEVRGMGLSVMNRVMTGGILKYALRRRAYAPCELRAMASAAGFQNCAIDELPIGFEGG
jgi:ubiquinone/menaquinone biosynthesis C-methylase UbiE